MRTQFFPHEIKIISQKNPKTLFKAICFNYADKNQYYVKHGKIALAESFNENYAFEKDKKTFNQIKGIFELIILENTTKRIGLYSEN
jgi:hypothetical protein